MYIYNVTFLVDKNNKELFLSWFRDEALGTLVNSESEARSPRMTLVTEVPGDPDFVNHAASFAFQAEFPTADIAKKWAEIYLHPILGKYTAKFGQEHALTFATLLQTVDI